MSSQALTQETSNRARVPSGIRIASTLCWIVGLLTLLLAIGTPELAEPVGGIGPLLLNCAVGLTVCGAAILIRRQRRLGVLVLVLAWAAPPVAALANGQAPHGGPMLVIIALLLAGANWKHLH